MCVRPFFYFRCKCCCRMAVQWSVYCVCECDRMCRRCNHLRRTSFVAVQCSSSTSRLGWSRPGRSSPLTAAAAVAASPRWRALGYGPPRPRCRATSTRQLHVLKPALPGAAWTCPDLPGPAWLCPVKGRTGPGQDAVTSRSRRASEHLPRETHPPLQQPTWVIYCR